MEYKVSDGPFEKDNNSTHKMMVNLLIALSTIVLFSFYKNGIIPYREGNATVFEMFTPLLLTLNGAITGIVMELLYARFILKIKDLNGIKSFLSDSYSMLPGIILSLIIPINTPQIILTVGVMFSIFFGKLIYGGFGYNKFNPAALGRLFIISFFGTTILDAGGYLTSSSIDAVSSATPLSNISNLNYIGTYETIVEPFGNLLDLFLGLTSGSTGETSVLLILLAAIFLIYKKVINWKIPVFYISTVFIMTMFIGLFQGNGLWYPLFHIFSGGLMFGAVFMATDPVTSPVTKKGYAFFGISLGLITVVLRFLTSYPEGVITSILLMNLMVPHVNRIANKASFSKKILRRMYLGIIALVLYFSITIGYDLYIVSNDDSDPDFEITSKIESEHNTIYIVTQKGFSSTLKAEISIDQDGNIMMIEMIDANDSFYYKVEEEDFIIKLIEYQGDYENLDTVSGATKTSSSLLRMIENTLKDFNEEE